MAQAGLFYEGDNSLETIKEDLIKLELKLSQASREHAGWEQYKLDIARGHVEVAMKQIYHILDPRSEQSLEGSEKTLPVGAEGSQ